MPPYAVPKSWIVPLSLQVQSLALVQTHPPPPQSPHCPWLFTVGAFAVGQLVTCGTGHCPAAQHPRQGTKQSSSVSFCTPASRMGRDKIKEVAEAVACLAFPWWYRNPREESTVSVQGVQLPASCTPPATRDKVMLSQATALCSVCNIYSHVTSCNSVIPGQNPNSKQPVGGGSSN